MSTTSISELKSALSEFLNRAAYGRERIIVASRGKPKAAVISIEDLHRLEELEDAMTYRIEIERRAHQALGRLPKRDRVRMVAAIDALAEDPRPAGAVGTDTPFPRRATSSPGAARCTRRRTALLLRPPGPGR
jgi:prevent-host-death family protein